MEYEPDGKILRKDVSASGNITQTGYDNFYSYNTDQPHTISKLSDGQRFTWDKNGNMTEHFKKHFVRYLAWDEENRLMGVADNNQVSFYLYDAAGERTVKFTGHNQWIDVNGVPEGYAGADKLTLYASPYLVATSGQYTKHYYAGEQRILSKIGGGGLGNYNAGIIAPETHRKKVAILENMVRFIGNTLYLKTLSVKPKPSVPCNQEGMLVDLCNYRNIVHSEEDRYFYHPDHLGSSSWITDRDGMPMQHLAYLPFGEEFVDQKTSNWSAAYKFSGKEKDEETGYNYFHARYYSSDLGIFIGIDPESDRYPSLSGYSYCSNNPIMLIDPDGKTWETTDDKNLAYDFTNRANKSIKFFERTEKKYQKEISKLEKTGENFEKIQELKSAINDFREQGQLLKEGIKGLEDMGKDQNTVYHFNIDANRINCDVTKTRIDDNGRSIIDMNAACNSTAWHEMIHVSDFLNKKFRKQFNSRGVLSTNVEDIVASEIHAYRSEFVFGCGRRDVFESVSKLSDINADFIKKRFK